MIRLPSLGQHEHLEHIFLLVDVGKVGWEVLGWHASRRQPRVATIGCFPWVCQLGVAATASQSERDTCDSKPG